jgi:aspartate 1-decarboxylase
MQRIMLKSKIHRATVTEADLHYVGSITIDRRLMEMADIIPYERVQVVDIENGNRLETYAIEGEEGSGTICINGAAARLIHRGDRIIIFSYAYMDDDEARSLKPIVIYVDEKNMAMRVEDHVDPDDTC